MYYFSLRVVSVSAFFYVFCYCLIPFGIVGILFRNDTFSIQQVLASFYKKWELYIVILYSLYGHHNHICLCTGHLLQNLARQLGVLFYVLFIVGLIQLACDRSSLISQVLRRTFCIDVGLGIVHVCG